MSSPDRAGSAAVNQAEIKRQVDYIRTQAQQWRRDGKDPTPLFEIMSEVGPLLKQGRHQEAQARIDQAMALVDPSYQPAPGGSGAGTPGSAGDGSTSQPSAPLPPPMRGGPTGRGWRHASTEPVIDKKHAPAGMPSSMSRSPVVNWNDPSVMKVRSGYSMWASVGLEGGGKNVSIYRFNSPDGYAWTMANGGRPVLGPGGKRDFDFYGVETPAVIKVGSTYHMYYTAYHEPDPKKGGNKYTMGHATSTDGNSWTKLGELDSLTGVVGKRTGNPWGWLARAEPAITYHDGTFYLYFADVKCRTDSCQGMPAAIRGISLATSRDGHIFQQVGSEPVLLQSASYPPPEGWEGYSTPWVYHDGANFQLYVDLFRHVPHGHFQTRIAHYESADGRRFREVEADIVKSEGHPWATMSVRAPTVVEADGEIKLWYGGDSFDKRKHTGKDVMAGRVYMGIGLVTKKR